MWLFPNKQKQHKTINNFRAAARNLVALVHYWGSFFASETFSVAPIPNSLPSFSIVHQISLPQTLARLLFSLPTATVEAAARKFYLIITIIITVMIIQFRICCSLVVVVVAVVRHVCRKDGGFVPWHMVRLPNAIETKELNKTKIQRTCKIPNNFVCFFIFSRTGSINFVVDDKRGLMLSLDEIYFSAGHGDS